VIGKGVSSMPIASLKEPLSGLRSALFEGEEGKNCCGPSAAF